MSFKKFLINQYRWFKQFLIVKSNKYTCDIKCYIPKSTIIKHYGIGIVISDKVQLGENNVLRQNLILGNRKGICNIRTGYNVDFGSNVTVLGNVKIGANSVILKDVPDNRTIVGIWK